MTPPIFSVTITLNIAYLYRKFKSQASHICLLFMKQHLELSVLVELKCRVHSKKIPCYSKNKVCKFLPQLTHFIYTFFLIGCSKT